MNAEELRALRKPYKEKYRSAPETALGIALRDATIHAEGDLDFRGTLGVEKSAPVGFNAIRLRFVLDTDAAKEQVDKLQQLAERYCVVYQTLRQPPEIQTYFST